MRQGNGLSRRRAMGLLAGAALAGLLAGAGPGCGSVGGGKTVSRKTRVQPNDPRQATRTLQQTRRVPGP